MLHALSSIISGFKTRPKIKFPETKILEFKTKTRHRYWNVLKRKDFSPMLIGYARVSTEDQNLDLQIDALTKIGCERLFNDQCSGANDNRPGLTELLKFAREGDVIVVWKLDRLGRSLKHLVRTVDDLQSRGVGLRSLQESIDTTTPGGKLVFHVFAALAEFERDLIRERTKAGLASAKARGRVGGRPKAMDQTKLRLAQTLMKDPESSIEVICRTLQVSKSTLYRYTKENNAMHTAKMNQLDTEN